MSEASMGSGAGEWDVNGLMGERPVFPMRPTFDRAELGCAGSAPLSKSSVVGFSM